MIVSAHAAARVEQVGIDYRRIRTGALAGVTGNPYGAQARPAGTGWAFLAAGLPAAAPVQVEVAEPGEFAQVYAAGGVGYLATAATLPEFRGQGVQTALIRHRLAVARDGGCDLVAGHIAAGSASQRTMGRCGLRLAFTKASGAPGLRYQQVTASDSSRGSE